MQQNYLKASNKQGAVLYFSAKNIHQQIENHLEHKPIDSRFSCVPLWE